MFTENLCRKAYRLIRTQCSICVDIQREFVVIGNLADTGIFHGHIYTLNRSIDGIHSNNADRHILCFCLIRAHIAASLCYGKLHVELAVRSAVQCRYHLVRVYDFDILICLNIRTAYNTLALILDISSFRFIRLTVIPDIEAFQIHDNLSDIFLNARNGTEFMEDSLNLYLADSRAGQRRKHDSAKRIPQCCAVPSFQRLHNKSAELLII